MDDLIRNFKMVQFLTGHGNINDFIRRFEREVRLPEEERLEAIRYKAEV